MISILLLIVFVYFVGMPTVQKVTDKLEGRGFFVRYFVPYFLMFLVCQLFYHITLRLLS